MHNFGGKQNVLTIHFVGDVQIASFYPNACTHALAARIRAHSRGGPNSKLETTRSPQISYLIRDNWF